MLRATASARPACTPRPAGCRTAPKHKQSRTFATQAASAGKIKVQAPGLFSLVQDYPGREGLWRVGVPPSGPMDHYGMHGAVDRVKKLISCL